jgi:hypothetical protein
MLIDFKQIVVIGVNYNAYNFAKVFSEGWSNFKEVKHIIIIDNFSCQSESARIRSLSKYNKVQVICLSNEGYGRALNEGLRHAANFEFINNSLVLFGNVDINPISVELFQ